MPFHSPQSFATKPPNLHNRSLSLDVQQHFPFVSLLICMWQACFGNLFSFICSSLNQYLTARIHEFTNKGCLPRSPYTILSGVFNGTFKKRLQAKVWTFSMTSMRWRPHTSEPYRTIGWICTSNILKKKCLPRQFTKFTQNSDTIVCCFLTFGCQETTPWKITKRLQPLSLKHCWTYKQRPQSSLRFCSWWIYLWPISYTSIWLANP